MKQYYFRKKGEVFALIEKKTGLIIDYYQSRSKTIEKSKFMSSGGAFNGFTPSFMCVDSISSAAFDKKNHAEGQTAEPYHEEDVDHLFSVAVERHPS